MKKLGLTTAAVVILLAAQQSEALAAGNVTAVQIGDTLFVIGDQEGNTVSLPYAGAGGQVYVAGYRAEFPGDWQNPVNGEYVVAAFQNVVDIVVLTFDGSDWVEFDGDLPGDLYIDTGSNADRVRVLFGSAHVLGDLFINTGPGSDAIQMEALSVHGATEFETGLGDDSCYFTFWNSFASGLKVDTGLHDDTVKFLWPNEVGETLLINLGPGKDTLESESMPAYPGVDVTGDATLNGEGGKDVLLGESGIEVSGELTIIGFE